MVSKVMENGIESGKTHSLPPGDYHLIGWDVDTTGRRLVDEICQIAAYTPTANFSQYVMPFQQLNPAARRRHNIRVVTIGRFRMLKDSKTNKVLKTKSEISALTDFVQWLEMVKGKSGDGVILVNHESRKVAAPLLLEALRKYNMLDKFTSVVKGFANGFSVAEVKCAKTIRSFSLRTLTRVLLDKDEELDSAVDRARLAFQIVQHLCGGEERQGSGDGGETTAPGLVQAISEFTQTIAQEEEELARVKSLLERQNSLRPVFSSMLRQDKSRAINLRKLVAASGIDYDMLTNTYKQKGDAGIVELINTKLHHAKPRDIDDLKSLLHDHFEGENKSSESKPLPQRNKSVPVANPTAVAAAAPVATVDAAPAPTTALQEDSQSENPLKVSISPEPVIVAAVAAATAAAAAAAAATTTTTTVDQETIDGSDSVTSTNMAEKLSEKDVNDIASFETTNSSIKNPSPTVSDPVANPESSQPNSNTVETESTGNTNSSKAVTP